MNVKTAVQIKQEWQGDVKRLVAMIDKLVARVPSKGDTEQSCQHCVLVNRLEAFKHAVNGTEAIDFLSMDQLEVVDKTREEDL